MIGVKMSTKRVPEEVYNFMRSWGKKLDVPTTKAFTFRERIIQGNFTARRVKRKGRGGKEVFEIEF